MREMVQRTDKRQRKEDTWNREKGSNGKREEADGTGQNMINKAEDTSITYLYSTQHLSLVIPECLYLQQEVEKEAQKWMIILSIIFFLLFFFSLRPLLIILRLRRGLETRGERCNKLHDIFHRGFTLVDNHGVLQVVDKLIVEKRLVLELVEETEGVIGNRRPGT